MGKRIKLGAILAGVGTNQDGWKHPGVAGNASIDIDWYIAQAKAACGGDLERIKRVVKLTVFVNSAAGFAQQPEVANGASDLFVEIFGEAGKHARSAVGAVSLPRNVATEVEAIFEIA